MEYKVNVIAGGFQHPSISYDTYQEGIDAVEAALETGIYITGGETGKVVIQLGEGTLIKLMSMQRIEEEKQLRQAARRNPLLAARDRDAPTQIVVQVGNAQLPSPVEASSMEEAETSVVAAIETGIFRQVIEAEHDYLWIQTGPGTAFMILPTEVYVQQERQAIEMAMRQAAAAAQRPQGQQRGPSIIMPGGGGGRRN